MAKIKLSLSVAESHLDKLEEVAAAAERAGMTIKQRLGDLGILTGSIDAAKLAALRRVGGVADVEEEREVRLPPPGGSVQ